MVVPRSGARTEPRHSPGTGATAALRFKRDRSFMMYDLSLVGALAATGITLLAAVYLWSKDPGRRRRAWQLLKLLLGRL